METIAQIASVISGLTALTTSLRAVGKSRESSGLSADKVRKIIFPYRMVSVVWFVLAIIFAFPSLSKALEEGKNVSLLFWAGFFLLLIVLNGVIWRRVKSKK